MKRFLAAAAVAVLAFGLMGANVATAGGKNGGGGGGGNHGGKNGGGGGGGGGVIIKRVVVCVFNNHVVRVSRIEDCGVRRYVRIEKRRVRTVRYAVSRRHYCAQPGIVKNGGGGDYMLGGGVYLGSPAAAAQWRRRAAAHMQFSGGYVGEPVYGGDAYVGEPVYGGDAYVGEGAYYNTPAPVMLGGHIKVWRKYHRHSRMHISGVVKHHGPVIMKGGAY